ncbi:O-acetyl-ADP-ribose deacetylase [Herbaspirillum sp. B65]|jgi:O-acetyl-ADP-ribose deacetylase (regulator of RNase III)|uniref:O-acetyl-ADP-ribose deacetylase n=1 Tax=Herbaspirillum sp. B65 TaxID=137708 RepID=UPI0005CAEA79|nr:O-acetyl-ADP-ribose deacetylase [Herbaspirillum sp. B65]
MSKINIVRGDITILPVDIIVNAANTSLLGGGGVDGAIHRKGGPEILDQCTRIRARQGGCEVGDAVATTAGKLPAKYVIHAVGPTWQGGKKGEQELLRKTYLQCLNLAKSLGMESISFPNISTGTYRFPKRLAACIAIDAVQSFQQSCDAIKTVNFVCFEEESYELYRELLNPERNEF